MSKYKVSKFLGILQKTSLNPDNSPIRRFVESLAKTGFNLNRSSALLLDYAVRQGGPGKRTEQYFLKVPENGLPDREAMKQVLKSRVEGGRSLTLFTSPGRTSVIIVDFLEAGGESGANLDNLIVLDPLNPFKGDRVEDLENSLFAQTVDDFLAEFEKDFNEFQKLPDLLEAGFDIFENKFLNQDALFAKIHGFQSNQPLIWISREGSGKGDQENKAPQEISLPSKQAQGVFPGISENNPLMIVSFGHMAKSILNGLVGLEYKNVHIVSPARNKGDPAADKRRDTKDKEIAEQYPGASVYSADKINKNLTPSFILIAAKPKMLMDSKDMDGLAKYYAPFLKDTGNCVVISVLAGTSIATVKDAFGNKKAAVARVMPNLAASVNESASTLCFSEEVAPQQKETVARIFNAIGSVAEVPEKDMDIMTAIAGCGPGVVFALLEAYLAACCRVVQEKKVQLNEGQVKSVLLQVFSGAVKMANKGEVGLTRLRQNVCSAEGMTVEIVAELLGGVSLAQLEADKKGEAKLDINKSYLSQLIKIALDRGVKRGQEMEKQEKPKNVDVPTSKGWKH
ncbi:MAG: hypothetical protein MI743_00760 [Sneathiellales bacterium]|nr:hypothetical protein [Sneathiellales bacterium]